MGIDVTGLDLGHIHPGDSIAVSGACLTVTQLNGSIATFDVSSETLSKCLIGKWNAGDLVNLERALTLQTPIGGHLVSGHIDGTAKFVSRHDENNFTSIQFEVDRSLGQFIAKKGSMSIDGVSLTTNNVEDINDTTQFDAMLVPHTLENTTLSSLGESSEVHIEVDQFARYIHRLNESNSR